MSVQSYVVIDEKSKELAQKFAQIKFQKRINQFAFLSTGKDIKSDYKRYFDDDIKISLDE